MPIVAIVLGNTMTAVAVAARLALDTLKLRAGEIEAALSSCHVRARAGWIRDRVRFGRTR